MRRRIIPWVQFLVLLLAVLTARAAQAQCQIDTAPANRQLWDDTAGAITVIVPPELEAQFETATTGWNSACGGGAGGSRNAPAFDVQVGSMRIGNQTERNSILVVIEDTPRQNANGQYEYGHWGRNDPITGHGSVIAIPRFQPDGVTPLDLTSGGMIAVYMHELGHALGLGHDAPSIDGMSCRPGVMSLPPTSEIHSQHCEIVSEVQEPECGNSSVQPFLLATEAAGRGGLAACPADCDCPGADNPDPLDRIGGFCERFPEACPGGAGGDTPWWDDDPFARDWGVQCEVVSWSDSEGNSGFSVDCRVIYYILAAGTNTTSDETQFEGDGPYVRLDSPTEGAAVSGRVEIKGSAVSPDGIGDIAVWLDDQPITLEEWKTGQPWGNCTHPRGGNDPDCPNVGFSGFLDTSKLSPGEHRLQIVAVDRRNPYPRPGMMERTIIVGRTCTDTTKPTITLTTPAAAATVSTVVPIAVTAADDVAVTKVQFFLNGTMIGEDRQAPWETRWDSRRVPNGTYALNARAIDACENYRISSTILITVLNGVESPRARNDRATTNVGVGVVINVLQNDVDPDGQALKLDTNAVVVAPKHGTATRVSDSSIRYIPAAGFSGNDGFRYKIVDTTGRSDTAWVTVEVSGINERPVAVDDTASGRTNRALTIDVLANDSDPDNDLLSLVGTGITQPPLHGRAERVSRTSVSYTPGRGFTGTDRFQYEIGDGKGKRARAWVTVTITDTNRPPLAVNDSASTSGNAAVTIDVTANDSDPDGDLVLLISSPIVIAPQHGTATKVSGSSIVYRPANGYTGSDTFQYEIGDGNGKRARATVTVTIAALNRAPVAENDAATTTTSTAITINVTANDSDPDGDPLTVTGITAAPANGSAVKVSASSITYAPRSGFTGSDTFQYEVGDGRGLRSRATVTLTVNATGGGNRNPVAVDDSVTTRRDTAIDINVTANDSDPDGDPVTLITAPIIVAPAHGTATKLSGSTIRYTPAANWVGTATFLYEAGDGRGARTRAWVTIAVTDTNNRPIGRDDAARVAPNGEVSINVTANDTDPDGDAVTLIGSPVVTAPLHGTAVKVNGSTIKYTPTAGYYGTDRFQYEAGDGHGARTRAWVDVTVTYEVIWAAYEIANMAPLATNDLIVSRQGETLLNLVTNDLDPDHDYLALTAQPVVTAPQHGAIRRVSDTAVAYTPGSGFSGNDAFEYEVADPNGVTSRAWVAVYVPAENEPPLAAADSAIVAAGRQVTLGVLANDSDPNVDTLQLTEVGVATWPSHGIVRRLSSRELVYLPQDGYVGPDSFEYEVTDGRGATARALVSLTITDQNVAPRAVADSFATDANVAVALPVLANDTDPNGDALRVVSSSQPAHGSVTWDPDPTAPGVYTPHPGYSGSDSFTYTISDAAGVEASATVSITVRPLRRAPYVQNDTAETKTLTPVLIGVLANDFDLDGNRLTVKSVSTPAKGTVAITHGSESVTYTPAAAHSGVVTFTYVAADGTGLESTATVTVTVKNEAPQPRNDSFAGIEDTVISYGAYQFLGNDTDPDGHELKIIAVTQPANGTLQYPADFSSFSYKPKAEWSGNDGFFYTVSDGFGGTAQAYVQIGVRFINDAPVANTDTFTVYKNQLLTITQAQVVANDTDVEGHSISVYSVGAATNGSTLKLANGSIEYRPYGEFTGSDSFEYMVQDGGGAYASGRINITVLQDTKPVPNFTVTCNGRACVFDASSSTDDRGIVLYQWTLGNNQAASGKTFNYTYQAGGVYAVRLTVQDTLGQTAIVQKTIIVTEPPPDARDDSYSWRKGYARYIEYTAMLANDVDPNNDTLTVQSVDSALTSGTVTCDTTGCLFTPPSSYWYGQTTFKYTVSDGHGQTDTATVTINFTF